MRLLLVEDEPTAARRLTRLVGGHPSPIVLVHVEHVAAAIEQLRGGTFDGVLLDLNLGGQDGFEVISEGGDLPVIVISAHVDRSIEAFDHAVLDFVPKPVVHARFAKALDRLIAAIGAPRRASLIVRTAGRIEIVDCGQVVRIQGADDYAELVLADGRHLLHGGSLAVLERRLPAYFVRTHRSHIVNKTYVTAVARTDTGFAVAFDSGASVPIGRRRLRDVERRLLG